MVGALYTFSIVYYPVDNEESIMLANLYNFCATDVYWDSHFDSDLCM